jgi:hypothetical protein
MLNVHLYRGCRPLLTAYEPVVGYCIGYMLIRSRHCWCVSIASPRLSIFMLTSVQYPQLLWMLTYNIWSYGSLWLYNYLYIHTHTCMHMSIYVITMYVCSLMLCDWMIGIQRRSRTHPFSDGAAVKPRVVAVLHHVEAEWLPCAQWSMSSDGWIVFW